MITINGESRLYTISSNSDKLSTYIPATHCSVVSYDDHINTYVLTEIVDGKPITRNNQAYDKAHNELLQILVTQGVFSFLSYVCLYFLIIKNGIKYAFKDKEIYYILPIIGYIVQAMFSISVVTVAPIFYIAMGLTINRENS